uniref:G-protein coupled receptors family 1 profile domain-containing protein n=1 Tax=Salvator merianae TaxID=96440 RepID=A0A8D0BBC3_SALMN
KERDSSAFREGNRSHPFPLQEEDADFFEIGIENIVSLVVFGLIFALGVVGNSLVITVLARCKPGKPRSTTNIFILNLSIADLAYLLFCVPFQSIVYALPSWVLGTFICKFTHYFFTVSMLVSIFTLSAMSVDRYVAIVHSRRSSSLRVSRNALFGVGVIWLLSIAMASPVAHHQHIVHTVNKTFCWEAWPNLQHKKVYVFCTFVFGYLIPLLLISFCYAKLYNVRLLVHLNSSVNPIIYAFLSENFRKAYKQVFKCQTGNKSPQYGIKENNIDIPPSTNSTHV